MMEIKPITLATASQLLNFAGRSEVARLVAGDQLEGAVALHNLLARPGNVVAYLADEVGTGKTFVLLGTIALLRHYHPQLRVLYIVPKANLQDKWHKEIRNFTANNWRVVDHRVKSFQGNPVVAPVLCDNLLDLVREVALDANRDFILRLSSFSLPLKTRDGGEAWEKKAEQMRRAFPGLAEKALEIDGRTLDAHEERKDAFACAVNELLPHFDLLVFDEGQNLKHGFKPRQGAARNRLLAYVLGTQKGPNGRRLERRIDRAVILSATPVDYSYEDLWNQLDLLGLADARFQALNQEDADEARQRDAVAQCLIRRLTSITIGGTPHTRNMYRREWRGGGVSDHDQALEVPTDLQRLIVALMQKKVADVLDEPQQPSNGNSEPSRSRGAGRNRDRKRQKRFSRSFQIGMLSSFESFGRAAKLTGDDSTFYETEQSDDPRERQGIDTSTVNEIATSYRRVFQDSLPHPKMNAVADDLWRAFLEGRKTLVFVRRILSVPEMVEKLTKKYDDWLAARVRGALEKLPEAERLRFDKAYSDYQQGRTKFYSRGAVTAFAGGQERAGDETESESGTKEKDIGGSESFFSWFFRGQGPPDIVSGASFSKNRLRNESAQLSTLFEDNWVLSLLNYPADPLAELAKVLDIPADQLATLLRRRAAAIYGLDKAKRLKTFRAYQQAALELIGDPKGRAINPDLAEKARIILEQFGRVDQSGTAPDERSFPDPQRYLGLKTFFTELAQRRELCAALWPFRHASESGDTPSEREAAFLEREQRRLLLSSAIRLGHPMIDLWLLHTKLTGTLAPGRDDEAEPQDQEPPDAGLPLAERLSQGFVDLLDCQRHAMKQNAGPTSFAELHSIATDFSLLVDVNFHDMRDQPLSGLPRYFGEKIGQQQPFAGMYGGFSKLTVRQFRMPGYPYVLVTTDVLQEGEDLHTYCDRIVHYGISWTPSATEQRIGRVDRIGSLVQRQLKVLSADLIDEGNYLQVYFPYLRETYEFVQVGKVFERLNRFLEMLHDLRLPRIGHRASEVAVTRQNYEPIADVFQQYRKPLTSGFPIPEGLIDREGPAEPVVQPENERLLRHFDDLVQHLKATFLIERNDAKWTGHERKGKAFVRDGRLLSAGEDRCQDGLRQQPFSLTLRTTHGGRLLLRCASPLGTVDGEHFATVLRLQGAMPHMRVCADRGDGNDEYHLSVQSDLLFSPETTQLEELEHVFSTMLVGADEMEKTLFEGKDHTETDLAYASEEEANHGSD